uniref:Activin_recp domain-containing protein n=1 Tax=Steinernema glaseri TaxID=37863 RepID=A0A1I7YJS9_9BILA
MTCEGTYCSIEKTSNLTEALTSCGQEKIEEDECFVERSEPSVNDADHHLVNNFKCRCTGKLCNSLDLMKAFEGNKTTAVENKTDLVKTSMRLSSFLLENIQEEQEVLAEKLERIEKSNYSIAVQLTWICIILAVIFTFMLISIVYVRFASNRVFERLDAKITAERCSSALSFRPSPLFRISRPPCEVLPCPPPYSANFNPC